MRFRPLVGSRIAAAIAAAMLIAGCNVAKVPDPVTTKFGADDPDSQIEFWHELAQRPVACNDEATHALLLFVDGKAGEMPYEQRVAAMKDRKLLPKGFNSPPDEAVQRGTLAYGLVEALNIRGGMTLRIFGNSPRYALKELEYMGLFPVSSTTQTFSGTELVGVFGKAEDFQRGGGGEKTPDGLAGNVDQHQPTTRP
jgi:hypothetical protein